MNGTNLSSKLPRYKNEKATNSDTMRSRFPGETLGNLQESTKNRHLLFLFFFSLDECRPRSISNLGLRRFPLVKESLANYLFPSLGWRRRRQRYNVAQTETEAAETKEKRKTRDGLTNEVPKCN